jgi:hypothetical protein
METPVAPQKLSTFMIESSLRTFKLARLAFLQILQGKKSSAAERKMCVYQHEIKAA